MTEAYATVKMPAEIGPNQQATLRCKVDTSAGGNVMPLHAFSKLFPRCVTTDRTPTGLRPNQDLPDSLQWIHHKTVWNVGQSN